MRNTNLPHQNRRQFLQTTAVATSLAASGDLVRAEDRYHELRSSDFLGEVEILAEIKDDDVFTEGPAVDREGNLLFTNVPASKILKWDPAAKQLTTYQTESPETNGLAFDPLGRLIACEGGARRVTRTDPRTKRREVLAEGFDGKPLAKPNDVCLDRAGRIYFTSRSAVEDPPGENPKGVYRIDPDGNVHRLLAWPDVHMPNGIVTSPDDKTLYLIEAHPDADRHRDIRAFDLAADGSISNGRVLIKFYPGRSGDGMCIDAKGNLLVAAGLHKTRKTSETLDTKPGIHVVSPQGKLLAFAETPVDTITNCTFGGDDLRTLYVTCGNLLVSLRTAIPGKPSYRPKV
jgi:gluconolactonase